MSGIEGGSNRFALCLRDVRHRYGQSTALDGVSLEVAPQQIFGWLGPNGSGKSTLFRLMSTLVPVQSGAITIFGDDVVIDRQSVREHIGVVFQSPSLDRKLTVRENLECQAALYGIVGAQRRDRIEQLGRRLGVADRFDDRCEKLSGGLKRRVELAKGLMHQPQLLILDEPSTGLDPMARLELWTALIELRNQWGTTVVLTTHLLEEADKCDRLAILDAGRLVAFDTPDRLRRETGETVITIVTDQPERTSRILECQYGWAPIQLDQQVRVVTSDPLDSISQVLKDLGDNAISITIGRPGLEDVFIRKTGNLFRSP